MDNGMVREDGADVYDGNFPEIRGSLVGSHALVWTGYSEKTRRFYFRHSWQGWTRKGSISYAYFESAGGDFWAPLDTADTIIGKEVYQSIMFSILPQEASARATLTINGIQRTETLPAKIAIERGLPITIIASATGYKTQTLPNKMVDESVNWITITLEAESKPVIVPLWQQVLNWLLTILDRLTKR